MPDRSTVQMPNENHHQPEQDLLPPTRASAVATQLRKEIQGGDITPGTHLRQLEVAKRYGVSTTPVREAFVTLAREGLVRQDAHRGVIVFAPSTEELAEIYEIRELLEPEATKIAGKKISSDTLDELEDIVAQMRQADPREYSVLNTKLHTAIYRVADRPRMFAIIENLRENAAGYLMIAIAGYSDSYLDEVQSEHEEIVDRLRNGTPTEAANAVRRHLENSARQVTGLIDRVPPGD